MATMLDLSESDASTSRHFCWSSSSPKTVPRVRICSPETITMMQSSPEKVSAMRQPSSELTGRKWGPAEEESPFPFDDWRYDELETLYYFLLIFELEYSLDRNDHDVNGSKSGKEMKVLFWGFDHWQYRRRIQLGGKVRERRALEERVFSCFSRGLSKISLSPSLSLSHFVVSDYHRVQPCKDTFSALAFSFTILPILSHMKEELSWRVRVEFIL